ncbi:retrotransposon protein, putative, ty1-copia subclass [Tanacetum coccineum]
MKADGTIDKYKERLVIKGFRQCEGLDFFDNYLHVTRITSIRMVLAIVALRKLEVYQMDMEMIFLNGDLENVLYMNQPEGFMAPGLESKVCRIRYKFITLDTPTRELLKEKNRALEDMVNAMFLRPGLSHGISSRIDDEVVQDQRQRDDINLQYKRQDQPKEEEVEPRRSKRARIDKSFSPDFVSFMVENEPTSYREAWIFKKKMKVDGTIDKYKERLVIKGFRQCEGLDFFDNYLHVTRITSIRMVLAIVTLRKLEVYQMDMEMTFLNGDLENVLYMNQLEGFMAPGLESKVCRLVKSLYDSWEAPKQGHQFSPYHVRMLI